MSTWHSTSWLEIIAALLAIVYLLLAIKQRQACWGAALASSLLYVIVLFDARLYMESMLNLFYAAMAAYGYWCWTRGNRGAELQVSRASLPGQILTLAGVTCMALGNSYFLRRYTSAAYPFMDSLISWASVAATLLVARKIYENWYWWLVIDTVSACVYLSRQLYVTALLFLVYLVMIVIGMREWRRSLESRRFAVLC